jgi:hypothetical protein
LNQFASRIGSGIAGSYRCFWLLLYQPFLIFFQAKAQHDGHQKHFKKEQDTSFDNRGCSTQYHINSNPDHHVPIFVKSIIGPMMMMHPAWNLMFDFISILTLRNTIHFQNIFS